MPLLTKSVGEKYLQDQAAKKSESKSSSYLNAKDIPSDGSIRVTPCGDDSVTGFLVWTNDGNDSSKKIKMLFSEEPTKQDIEARADECGAMLDGRERSSQFFGLFVWNYVDECIQYFEFAQKSLVQPFVEGMSEEEIAADPEAFDWKLTCDRSGEFPKYGLQILPGWRRKAQYADKIQAAWDAVAKTANVQVALSGGDVFKGLPF
jgi:hypothetical protein